MPSPSCGTGGSPPAARTPASPSGSPVTTSRPPSWKGTRPRSSVSPFHPTATRCVGQLGQHGAAVAAGGTARRACSRATSRTSMASPSRRTAAPLVSASYDLTLRIWPLGGGAPKIVTLPAPLNAVAVAAERADRYSGRHRQGVLPVGCGRTAGRGRGSRRSDHRARRIGRWQARRGVQHSRRASPSSSRELASSSRPWSGPGCRPGR